AQALDVAPQRFATALALGSTAQLPRMADAGEQRRRHARAEHEGPRVTADPLASDPRAAHERARATERLAERRDHDRRPMLELPRAAAPTRVEPERVGFVEVHAAALGQMRLEIRKRRA